MRSARIGWIVLVALLTGLSACAQDEEPGPAQRAGARIDGAVANVQRSVGDFSERMGQGVDQAGRSVGATAQRIGTTVHNRLAPPDDYVAPNDYAAPGGSAVPNPPVYSSPLSDD